MGRVGDRGEMVGRSSWIAGPGATARRFLNSSPPHFPVSPTLRFPVSTPLSPHRLLVSLRFLVPRLGLLVSVLRRVLRRVAVWGYGAVAGVEVEEGAERVEQLGVSAA